ncbi:unnamed protein product, partial [marine sediment metagenome]
MFAATRKEPNRDGEGADRAATVRERDTNRVIGACRAARVVLTTTLLCAHAAAAPQPIAPPNTDEVIATTISDAAAHGHLRAFSLKDGLKLEPFGDAEVAIVPADEVVQIVVNHESRRAVIPGQRGSVEVWL